MGLVARGPWMRSPPHSGQSSFRVCNRRVSACGPFVLAAMPCGKCCAASRFHGAKKSLLSKACASATAFSMVAGALQADMFPDLPSSDASCGVVAELRQFYRASRELRGLLTQSQASRILNCQTGVISNLISRGRLSFREVAGVRMVSAAEILALHKERDSESRNVGGRGLKAPSLSQLADAAWDDMGMSE